MADDNSELDLEAGDEDRAERIAAATDSGSSKKPRFGSKKASGSSASPKRATPRATAAKRAEESLNARLVRAFDRIIEQLLQRGDAELATVIEEDKDAMAAGLVSLTRAVTWMRRPLVTALNFVEPVLAFGRVGKILVTRMVLRRQQQMEQQPEQPLPTPVGFETVPGTGY